MPLLQDSTQIAKHIDVSTASADTPRTEVRKVAISTNSINFKRNIELSTKVLPVKNHLDSSYLRKFEPDANFLIKNRVYHTNEYNNQPVFKNDTTQYKSVTINPIFKDTAETNLMAGFKDITMLVIIVIVSIYAWIRVYYGKFLNQIFYSTINYHESHRLFRSNNALFDRMYYVLNFISFIVIGFYIALLLKFNHLKLLDLPEKFYLLYGSALMIVFYLYKSFGSKFFGFIMNAETTFKEVLHSSLLNIKVFSIILIPIVSTIFFVNSGLVKTYIVIVYILFATVVLLTIYRTVRIFISKGFSFFYTMLYLCIVEILPLLFAFKLINK